MFMGSIPTCAGQPAGRHSTRPVYPHVCGAADGGVDCSMNRSIPTCAGQPELYSVFKQ